MQTASTYKITFFIFFLALSLNACTSLNVWPFNQSEKVVDAAIPKNSTEYICDSNKKFYVRTMDKGDSVWLILSDREVALNKISSDRYSNTITTLEINGSDATLEINQTITYKNCKASINKSL